MTKQFKNDPKKKRYYWLQLKEDFFNQKEIKLLRKIAGGDTYTIIYLKMLLVSLRDNGRLFFEAIGEDFSEEVALTIDESPEDVAITISYLEKKNLLEIIEQDEYFLNRVPEMVGSESYSAERMRELRKRKKQQKMLQSDVSPSQCDNNVSSSDEEIEIELEIELENKEILSGSPDSVSPESDSKVYSNVVQYLNDRVGSNYKHTTKATQTKIKARLQEGFTVEDMKQVIDVKADEWLNDGNMSKFLRPETLFGTKFESYLNQSKVAQKKYDNLNIRHISEYGNLGF